MSIGSNRHGSSAVARDADARLEAAITDFFLPDDQRLDERMRSLLSQLLSGVVASMEADIRREAALLLSARGATAKADRVSAAGQDVFARLTLAGVLRDAELMGELIARVRADMLAAALPVAADQADRPGLLVRLCESADQVVAAAAAAMLAAEARRMSAYDNAPVDSDLPAHLHHRLLWWVAAAIREDADDGDAERAIGEAAQRSAVGYDEGARLEAIAARLAVAIDPAPEEVPALLVDAIGDRRLTLFAAMLAHTLSSDMDVARELVIEPHHERLWLALRVVGLGRENLARVALALSDADPRFDIEAFADALDDLAAVDAATAREALAPLMLPRAFRSAIAALARGRGR